MASAVQTSTVSEAERKSFSECLQNSKNVMAFIGAGSVWRSYPAISLATLEAFDKNPCFVWQFYSYRRHMALKAKPNRAHFAKRNPNFVTLSLSVDGLSPRAKHPESQLYLLYRSLFDVKCASPFCEYVTQDYNDPIVPALGISKATFEPIPSAHDKTGAEIKKSLYNTMELKVEPTASATGTAAATATHGEGVELDISNANVPTPRITLANLPQCPKCGTNILRPGVVWFGESLPRKTLDTINKWIEDADRIDLMLVIGTTDKVYPASAYVERAREKGARVAVINMDINDEPRGGGLVFPGRLKCDCAGAFEGCGWGGLRHGTGINERVNFSSLWEFGISGTFDGD